MFYFAHFFNMSQRDVLCYSYVLNMHHRDHTVIHFSFVFSYLEFDYKPYPRGN